MRYRRFHGAGLGAAGVVFVSLGSGPAWATQLVLTSKAAYWAVGTNDPVLSQMCSTGQFNQKSVNKYIARFVGPNGQGVLGIAKGTGFNLFDPQHAAKTTEDYFFMGDGTSSCSVYVGGRKGASKPSGTAKPAVAPANKPPTAPTATAPTPPAAPGQP